MYREYWNLDQRPFDNTPDPAFFFKSAETAEIYARLLYALRSNSGAVMLTGDSGCGKTLITRTLIQDLEADSSECALVTSPYKNPLDFLREILYQLGENEVVDDHAQVLHRLSGLLYANFSAGKETAIIIDEGQLLESHEMLEQLRLLLNFQLNDAFLLTLVLVGQPELAQQVTEHPLLDERLSARAVLRPFAREEVGKYVEHRLDVAGRTEPIFAPAAIELIAQYSGGIPRRINQICDICLVIAFSRKVESVEEDLVYRLILNEEESRV